MAKVFISYSRKDTEFAKKLTGELQKSDLDFWIDWEGIPPTVDWMKEIEKGIEEADAFVAIVSAEWISSKICKDELDLAIKNGKRLIPVVPFEITWDDVPAELSHLNYIFFREGDEFDTAINNLLIAIQTDYDWVETHRRLQVKALEWERNHKDNGFLLRGKDLQGAELQLATNSSKEPLPTELQRGYVFESRKATDRQRRITTSISIAGIIILAVLAVYAFIQAGIARTQLVRSENLRLVAEANTALSDPLGNPETAALLGLKALRNEYYPAGDTVLVDSISRLYTMQIFHEQSQINSVAVSPDGKISATAGDDGIIHFWDTATGQEKTEIKNGNPINAIAFSPDGMSIAMTDINGITKVVNVETKEELLEYRGTNRILLSITFSPDGKSLLANGSEDNTIGLWDIASGEEVLALGARATILSVAISPDGNYFFIGETDSYMTILDIRAGEYIGEVNSITGNAITSISVSSDGTLVATGSYKDATIWDVKTQEAILSLEHPDWVNGVAISPNGKYLVTGGGDFIARIWDIKTGEQSRALVGHTDIVTSVAYSPDGSQVLTGSKDNTTRLWNADVNYNQRIFNTRTDAVWDVAFSPDGKSIVTGSHDPNDHNYKIWDLETGRQIGSLAGDTAFSSSISYSNDGNFILTSNVDGSVRIWDAKTMRRKTTLIPVTNGAAYDAAFSSDGKYVITGSSNNVALAAVFDAKTGEQLLPLQHTDLVTSVLFTPDGKFAFTACEDKMIRKWDMETGEVVLTTSYASYFVQAMAISNDGKYILIGAEKGGAAGLIDVNTGELVKEFLHNNDSGIYAVTFSPDGKYALTGSFDRTARLWDIESGDLIRTFKHKDYVNAVSFSPDGKLILTGTDDGSAYIFDTSYRDTLDFVCSLLHRELTEDEIQTYEVKDESPVCRKAE